MRNFSSDFVIIFWFFKCIYKSLNTTYWVKRCEYFPDALYVRQIMIFGILNVLC